MAPGGPVVLITGCSDGGIGAELCIAFKQLAGADVFATARSMQSMAALKPLGIHTLQLDVTRSADIKAAVATVIQQAGRLDILVNNAGKGMVGPLAEIPLASARHAFDTNVWGLLECCQAVVPHMAARGTGTIVNIGSVAGLVSVPWSGVYSATKFAVHALSDALRMELAPLGIKVVVVAPGAIRSNIASNMMSGLDLSYLSLYRHYQPLIESRVRLSQGFKSTPTRLFAQAVVRQVLRSQPPAYYIAGRLSWLACLLAWALPRWLTDYLLRRQFGLRAPLPPLPLSPPQPEPQLGQEAGQVKAGAGGAAAGLKAE
ncbi:hypothetical protein V8C86DRAFT_2534736 [Haematococcus lacustris]